MVFYYLTKCTAATHGLKEALKVVHKEQEVNDRLTVRGHEGMSRSSDSWAANKQTIARSEALPTCKNPRLEFGGPRCCWLKTALSSSSWSPHCLVCTSPAAGGEMKQFAGHVPQQSSIISAPCTLYGITVARQVHPFMPHLTCVIQHSSSQSVSRNVAVISLVLKSLRRLKRCSTLERDGA